MQKCNRYIQVQRQQLQISQKLKIEQMQYKDKKGKDQQISVHIREQIQEQEIEDQYQQQSFGQTDQLVTNQHETSNIDEESVKCRYIGQLYRKMDQEISNQIIKIMVKEIGGHTNYSQKLSIGDYQQQYSNCIMHLMQQFNQTHQSYLQYLQKVQTQHEYILQQQRNKQIQQLQAQKKQHQQAIRDMEKKNAQKISSLLGQQENIAQQYRQNVNRIQQQCNSKIKQIQVKLNMEEQRRAAQHMTFEKLKQQISQKDKKINSFEDMVKSLENKIEKYEQQMALKNNIINEFSVQVSRALESTQLINSMYMSKLSDAYAQLSLELENKKRQQINKKEVIKQQEQIINALSKLCRYIQQQRSSQPQLSPIKQLDTGYDNIQDDNQIIMKKQIQSISELKLKQEQVIMYINKLIAYTRNLKVNYQNLNHKYAQFLKQTETKLQEYKNKSKQSEKNEKQLLMQIQSLQSANQSSKLEISRLLEMIRSNLDKEKMNSQAKIKRIQLLQAEVQKKESRIIELELIRKQEQEKFDKNISLLTIQIQSLKESISTLKNVVKFKDQKDEQPIDSTIVQQMIDKTYQIRLQNAKLKQLVSDLSQKYEQKCSELNKSEENKSKAEKNIEEDKKIMEQYEIQIKKYELNIELEQQKMSEMNKKINEYEQEVKEKQRKIELIQVKLLSKQNIISSYEQKLTTLMQEIDKNEIRFKQDQSKLNQLESQYRKVKQQLFLINHNQLVHQKVQTIGFEQNIFNYQRLQMQKLEIYVLNQIIRTKQEQYSQKQVIKAEAEVQVNFNNKETSHRNSPTTIRNCKTKQRARRSSQNESIGKLVLTKGSKNQPQKQGQCLKEIKNEQVLENLNKTCKLRSVPLELQNQKQRSAKNQVEEMNDIINYMVNFLKGYTRNGIRSHSWLTSQGEQYLAQIQNPSNIRQKYGTFQRVRSLIDKNQACKQLIRDYQKIANYYFNYTQLNSKLQDMPSVGGWQSFDKENIYQNSESSKNMTRFLDSVHLKTR